MRPILAVLLSLALSASAQQTTSTMCQATELFVDASLSERHLVGCGEGYPDNLLWHLDRSDSLNGKLDGKVTRRTTGRGALIYVLDTGVMQDHVEFARSTGSNVIGGFDVSGIAPRDCVNPAISPCYPSPTTVLIYGHGTGVASVAAGLNTGVAPGASIVSVLIVGGDSTKWIDGLKRVIRHAYDPATPQVRTAIITISTATDAKAELTALIERMTTGVDIDGNADPNGKRFFFSVMTGNYSEDSRSNQCTADRLVRLYPANMATAIKGVVSVGGIDRENRLWSGSCRGPLVEVLAPAADIFVASIYRRDSYRYKPEFYSSGTSWAAPYVAGMAARILEANPDLTPADVETLLRNSPSLVEGLPVPILDESPVVSGPRRRSIRH